MLGRRCCVKMSFVLEKFHRETAAGSLLLLLYHSCALNLWK